MLNNLFEGKYSMTLYDIKEDWDNVKKRWEAWWNFDLYDRPLLMVTAGKKDPSLPPELEDFKYELLDPERKYTDPEYMINKTLYEFYNTFYGGESIPVLSHGYAVGHALVLGCEPGFANDTIWCDPLPIKQGEQYPEIKFDEDGYWWRKLLDMTEKVSKASMQRYFVMPMWGNHAGDNLLICRGSGDLMLDMVENPEWVAKSVRYISNAMIKQFDALHELAPLTGLEGCVNYVSAWAPDKTHGFDADLSCMISPEKFKDILLEPLIETMRTVKYRIYHLDGVVSLHQLDTLLAIDELHGFQWVPGEGRTEIMQWIPLLKKMQEHKKSVLCYTSPDKVLPLIKELKSEGLCICTGTETEDDARRLVDSVMRLY